MTTLFHTFFLYNTFGMCVSFQGVWPTIVVRTKVGNQNHLDVGQPVFCQICLGSNMGVLPILVESIFCFRRNPFKALKILFYKRVGLILTCQLCPPSGGLCILIFMRYKPTEFKTISYSIISSNWDELWKETANKQNRRKFVTLHCVQ
jgi:hypothetical protein